MGAAVAILVLLVHSAHAHGTGAGHHWGEQAAAASMQNPALAAVVQLVDDHLTDAGCMALELTSRRTSMPALAAVTVGVVLARLAGSSLRVTTWDAQYTLRPPPGARRQAQLGVFLT